MHIPTIGVISAVIFSFGLYRAWDAWRNPSLRHNLQTVDPSFMVPVAIGDAAARVWQWIQAIVPIAISIAGFTWIFLSHYMR